MNRRSCIAAGPRRSKAPRPRSERWRPRVEPLEDRCVPALTALSAAPLTPTAGQLFTGPVAALKTTAPEDLSVTINWGDGMTSAGQLVPGPATGPGDYARVVPWTELPGNVYLVVGVHAYGHAGFFTLTVSVTGGEAEPWLVASTVLVGGSGGGGTGGTTVLLSGLVDVSGSSSAPTPGVPSTPTGPPAPPGPAGGGTIQTVVQGPAPPGSFSGGTVQLAIGGATYGLGPPPPTPTPPANPPPPETRGQIPWTQTPDHSQSRLLVVQIQQRLPLPAGGPEVVVRFSVTVAAAQSPSAGQTGPGQLTHAAESQRSGAADPEPVGAADETALGTGQALAWDWPAETEVAAAPGVAAVALAPPEPMPEVAAEAGYYVRLRLLEGPGPTPEPAPRRHRRPEGGRADGPATAAAQPPGEGWAPGLLAAWLVVQTICTALGRRLLPSRPADHGARLAACGLAGERPARDTPPAKSSRTGLARSVSGGRDQEPR